MNIILTFDNNYCQHAAVVMASICHNNNGNIEFYVVSEYISEDNLSKLTATIESYGCSLHYVKLSFDIIDKLPIGKNTANTYVNKSTYYRLFIPYIVDIDKALYLDCDIVVCGNINSFYNTQFPEDICIVGVEDELHNSSSSPIRLGYPIKYSYFNAGVLLLNLKLIRKLYSLNDLLECLEKNEKKIKYHDQDVLNILFHKHKMFVSLVYNLQDVYLIRNRDLPPSICNQHHLLNNPLIIHYSGPIKPWHIECRNPYKSEYLKYLKKTPWRDFHPFNKFDKLPDIVFFRIKKIIKLILELFHLSNYSYINLKSI